MTRTSLYLAANLRREMAARGWSQSELARRCGWAPSRISEILSQTYDPRITKLERIATALGITVSALVSPPLELVHDLTVDNSSAAHLTAYRMRARWNSTT